MKELIDALQDPAPPHLLGRAGAARGKQTEAAPLSAGRRLGIHLRGAKSADPSVTPAAVGNRLGPK